MSFENNFSSVPPSGEHCTTIEVARELGMAVRSVQMMVDRGELEAWKTPGGHRRISRVSVDRWLANRRAGRRGSQRGSPANPRRVLFIEDSAHYQNLVSLMMQQHFPEVSLHLADDGIVGLAMYGQLQPDVLLLDLLLPGIDGATLLTSLRAHPELNRSQLVVVTSLDEEQRRPYAFALRDIPLVYKPNLVTDLPKLLGELLHEGDASPAAAADARPVTSS
ncbi:helix-turn-helix domain-containing protein [Curvibacter gracilis]|uniref:helix-turn-helix domain-containing protein n=1 Tax=Curvibacter gracilis TaxID=230310 RepID=UPI000484E1BF|nr:helix-turn-helix domain-containing protein [Curvibacter gracilis]